MHAKQDSGYLTMGAKRPTLATLMIVLALSNLALVAICWALILALESADTETTAVVRSSRRSDARGPP